MIFTQFNAITFLKENFYKSLYSAKCKHFSEKIITNKKDFSKTGKNLNKVQN